MKKIFFIYLLFYSSLSMALSLEWNEAAGKREIKVLGDSLRYTSMKHGVETITLNTCSKKALSDWEKKLALASRRAGKMNCAEELKSRIELIVDNKVTIKRLNGCSDLTPSYSQVIGDILKCH